MDNLPSTALGALKLLASTQTQVDVFSDQLIAAVKEEGANPLEILVQLRAMEKVSARVIKEIMENAVTMIDRYNGRFELSGNLIERAEVGTTYDYSKTGDIILERRVAIRDAADSLVKERESFLRSLKEKITLVDEESGEIYVVSPPIKKSKTGVKVTIR